MITIGSDALIPNILRGFSMPLKKLFHKKLLSLEDGSYDVFYHEILN